MTRWYGNRVDLKSQKFVDVGLDSIVAAMNIPRNVGKPPWSRGGRGNNERGRRSNDYRGSGGGYYNNNNNYNRRYYEPPAPRVKRLRDDRWRARPRGWNHWSHTGGMYSDRKGGDRDYGYDKGGGWGGNYNRAPRYSHWYNKRNRYGDDDEEWEDEDGYGTNVNGSYSADHWNFNRNRQGRNDGYGRGNRYGGSEYGYGNRGNGDAERRRRSNAYGRGGAVDHDSPMETDDRSTAENAKTKTQSNPAAKVLHWPTLLISNLNSAVTDLDIYDLFQEFGNLKRANVHHDKYGNSLQTADVVFFSLDDAKRALKEYDNTPLDGCRMRIFLCNSFSETSISPSRSSLASEQSRRSKFSGGGGGGGGGGGFDRRGGSKFENPTGLFTVNDIPKVDSNKHFMNNFSDELKNHSSKPRIPIKQGKWWLQQNRGNAY